jgi:hypothetical protein
MIRDLGIFVLGKLHQPQKMGFHESPDSITAIKSNRKTEHPEHSGVN